MFYYGFFFYIGLAQIDELLFKNNPYLSVILKIGAAQFYGIRCSFICC